MPELILQFSLNLKSEAVHMRCKCFNLLGAVISIHSSCLLRCSGASMAPGINIIVLYVNDFHYVTYQVFTNKWLINYVCILS